MIVTGEGVVAGDGDAVEAVLRDVASWPDWVPGVRSVGWRGAELALELTAHRPLPLRAVLTWAPGRLDIEMLECEALVHGRVEVRWADGAGGAAVALRLDVVPVALVPGALWHELDEQVLPALLAALGERITARSGAAPPGTGPAGG